MAGSRLEKLGTIFSRTTALIRGGALRREDRPLWYDVYQVFPPKTEPSYAAARPRPEIREIFYPEDTVRAIFHKRMSKRMPMEDLMENTTTDLTRRVIDLTYAAMRKNESLTEEQSVEKAIDILKKEGTIDFRKQAKPLTEPKIETESLREEVNQQVEASTEEESKYKRIWAVSYVKEYEEAVKNISNKNVDISKIDEDEEDNKK